VKPSARVKLSCFLNATPATRCPDLLILLITNSPYIDNSTEPLDACHTVKVRNNSESFTESSLYTCQAHLISGFNCFAKEINAA
jgi:hypothetical protein